MREVIRRANVVAAVLLMAVGVAFLLLPEQWIENNGGGGDSGDGLFELLIGIVPLVIGLALLSRILLRRRSARTSQPIWPGERTLGDILGGDDSGSSRPS